MFNMASMPRREFGISTIGRNRRLLPAGTYWKAVDRTRTDDLLITSEPLYQLSYNGKHWQKYTEISAKEQIKSAQRVRPRMDPYCLTRVT